MGGGVGLAIVHAAHSDPAKRDAEQEMALAQAALDRNDYPEALLHFSSAQTLAPQASGPFLGLGLTYAAIDRCQEAVPLLEEYRRRKGARANPKAEHTIAECKSRPGTGKLILESRPTGVDVFRDVPGQPQMGRTPLVLDLPVGRHALILKLPGFATTALTVQIRSGQETRELAGLRAEAVTPNVAPTAAPLDHQLIAAPTREPSKPSRRGLYVGLGVGLGVAVVIGVIAGVVVGTRKVEPAPPVFPAIALGATQ